MARVPTRELGAAARATHPQGLPAWIIAGGGADEGEHVPDLAWPHSLDVYRRMSRSTGIRHLITSVKLPALGYKWWLDPQDADEHLVEQIALDLGLGVGEDGEPPAGRSRGRFAFREHLRLALDAPLVYGHAAFEQVAKVQQGGSRDGWVGLRKLAPRPQSTISGWIVADDGGLVAVQQSHPTTGQLIEIPVDRLIVYAHDMAPGVWVGEPILRSCFESWFLRDVLIRLDATKHDRNSMGIPTAKTKAGAVPSKGDRADALTLMQQVRSGDLAGLVDSDAYEFALQGVTGNTSDPIESVKYHDAMISKQFLAMVMDVVSSETGNRAVANTVEDKFTAGVDSICQQIADTFTAHQIEDMADWNGRTEAAVPRLRFSPADPEDTSEFLFQAVNAGVVKVDDELEDWARTRAAVPPRRTTPSAGLTAVTDSSSLAVGAAAVDTIVKPEDQWRAPSAVEVQAAVDYKAIARRWRDRIGGLVETLTGERAAAASAYAAQVARLLAAGDYQGVADLPAPRFGEAALAAAFVEAVADGAADHAREAAAQGATVGTVATAAERARAAERAALVAEQLGSELGGTIKQKAQTVAGPNATVETIEQAARAHAADLSTATLTRHAGAGVVSSTGEGRVAAMRQTVDQASAWYASELMDAHTCAACAENDGTKYESIEAALHQYPSGAMFVDCLGGDRCRGFVIAVYDETAPTLDEPGDGGGTPE